MNEFMHGELGLDADPDGFVRFVELQVERRANTYRVASREHVKYRVDHRGRIDLTYLARVVEAALLSPPRARELSTWDPTEADKQALREEVNSRAGLPLL
jgi:hypothetical protein